MTNTPIQLEDWSVGVRPKWTPNSGEQCLYGYCHHPSFPTPDEVITSPIVQWYGDIVITQSGSVYKLGRHKEE